MGHLKEFRTFAERRGLPLPIQASLFKMRSWELFAKVSFRPSAKVRWGELRFFEKI